MPTESTRICMVETFNRDWVARVYFPNRYFHIHHMVTMVYNGYSKIWEVNKVQYGVFKKVEYEHSNCRRPFTIATFEIYD